MELKKFLVKQQLREAVIHRPRRTNNVIRIWSCYNSWSYLSFSDFCLRWFITSESLRQFQANIFIVLRWINKKGFLVPRQTRTGFCFKQIMWLCWKCSYETFSYGSSWPTKSHGRDVSPKANKAWGKVEKWGE